MEDGPESVESAYEYSGKSYRLVERESERWEVYDNGRYLGVLIALPGSKASGPQYTLDFAGEEDKYDEPATDDWRLVLEYLIDNAPGPAGD